jgi:Rrf2 family protein
MLSKTALHALRAVTLLAEKPGVFQGAAAIADRVGAPPNYLGKLLQSLASRGLVMSQQGLGGGFRLRRKPGRITVFEVVEPIDHVSRWSRCFLRDRSCSPAKPCALHRPYEGIRRSYLSMLKTSTIEDVVNGSRRIFPRA